MSEIIEYPKALYKGGVEDCVTVQDEDGEAVARADGYEMYAEIHARENGKETANPSAKPKAK